MEGPGDAASKLLPAAVVIPNVGTRVVGMHTQLGKQEAQTHTTQKIVLL